MRRGRYISRVPFEREELDCSAVRGFAPRISKMIAVDREERREYPRKPRVPADDVLTVQLESGGLISRCLSTGRESAPVFTSRNFAGQIDR